MDITCIKDLPVETIIGVHAWERKVKQTLLLDLDMAWDNRPAGATDQLEQALDYEAVTARISAFVEQSSYELIEAVAENVARIVLQEFGVPWLRLGVKKTPANGGSIVRVVIERGRLP